MRGWETLVGRASELSILEDALADSAAGNGRLVLLTGEAGIGKTRLARGVVERARQTGSSVATGLAQPESPAFWPWVQLLRQVKGSEGGVARSHEDRQLADCLDELLSVAGMRTPDLENPSLSPELARFRLFDAVATYLEKESRREPLLLVLEDLHRADRSSLQLLKFVAQRVGEARLFLLATYRDTGSDSLDPTFLADLSRQPWFRQVQLGGLEVDATCRLIEHILGSAASEDVVTRIQQQTNGNPFFVTEVTRLLSMAGRTELSQESWPIPESVRVAIEQRLQRLPKTCTEFLTFAAFLGQDFPLALLAVVTETTMENLLESLSDAVATSVITPVDEGLGTYRFSHDLTRECLYQAVAPGQRAKIHRQVGDLLEKRFEDDPYRVTELAHHFCQAAVVGRDGKALQYCRRAAEQAAMRLAHEDAARYYERALRIIEQFQPTELRLRLELLLALGRTHMGSGEAERVRDGTFLQAVELARQLGDAEAFGLAAYGLGTFKSGHEPSNPELISLLEEAADRLSPADGMLRTKLLGMLSVQLRQSGEFSRGDELSDIALAMARRVADPSALGWALFARCTALCKPEDARERSALATEMSKLGRTSNIPHVAMDAEIWRAQSALVLGDMPTVRNACETIRAMARQFRHSFYGWWGTMFSAGLALLEGRLDEAEHLSLEALQLRNEHTPFVIFGGQMLLLYLHRGPLSDLEQTLGPLEERMAHSSLRCARAHLLAEQGRREEAKAYLDGLAARDFTAVAKDQEWHVSMFVLAHTAALVNAVKHAATLYRWLLPHRGTIAVGAFGSMCFGSTSLALGRLAATTSQFDLAFEHFEEAVRVNERIGALPWVAWTRLEWAAALLASGGIHNRSHVEEHLRVASGLARRLGLARVQERVDSLERLLAETGEQGSLGVVGAPPRPIERTRATLECEGDYWTVTHGRTSTRLKDQVGLRYLSQLLRYPGRQFAAGELIALCNPRAASAPGRRLETADRSENYSERVDSDAGSLLDAQAIASYRSRIEDLRGAVEEAERFNDLERKRRAGEELEFVTNELSRALGVGSRPRVAGSQRERARVSTTRALRKAIDKIRQHDAALGRHLQTGIKTGTFCSYDPEIEGQFRWELA